MSASAARILVVDDEPCICAVIKLILEQEGWDITTSRDGTEGLRQIQQEKFDLVITDREMPGLGGEALAQAIKLHSPETRIILMTGCFSAVDDATPFDGFLPKPFTGAQLLATVEDLLGAPAKL